MDELYDAVVQYPKSEKFALNVNNRRSNANGNIGFRAAYVPR